MNGYAMAAALLPPSLRSAFAALPQGKQCQAAEFRLRRGYLPRVALSAGEEPVGSGIVEEADLQWLVNAACASSPYTVRQSMAQGYVTAAGGVRLGLCGQMNIGDNGGYVLAELSSAAVRIPRQVIGCANGLTDIPFHSTLILSPPGLGKTTLLRDMIRQLSGGGIRVGLCDERGEVAAISAGEAGFDVGPCTDVISGMAKAPAAMALLRSMNPQILAVDEITAPEDIAACETAANCGVELLATVHGHSANDLCARALFRPLLEQNIFHRLIRILWENGQRTYQEIQL